ncbi:DUF3349 domain-containing protein [Rothia sp. ZJ1223]|uniref:DUF3349 domain-containing protein n=1 Tax=Rothia sp. ZJ1223 TaxID=2811098 RepID=UPI0019564D59|nr:DUF3349 domain-containing protein [Rothia sp. ZJ1223]MBM7051787.1 DUF3349 domain-containing protein [Rothia sp. ZJ1223]
MPDKNVISRVIDWLSAGYPEDVPPTDRAAVMAVLRYNLTDGQLEEVIRRLMKSREARGEEYVSDNRINEYIRKVVGQAPSDEDIDRVAKILGSRGLKIDARHLEENSDTATGEYRAVDSDTNLQK